MSRDMWPLTMLGHKVPATSNAIIIAAGGCSKLWAHPPAAVSATNPVHCQYLNLALGDAEDCWNLHLWLSNEVVMRGSEVVKWSPSASSNLTLWLTGRTLHFLPLRLTRLLCGWKVGHKCCFGKKFLVFYTHLGPKTNNESATILNLLYWLHKETPVDVMQTPDNTHGVRHQQKLDKMFCFQQISTKLFGSCLTILYSL